MFTKPCFSSESYLEPSNASAEKSLSLKAFLKTIPFKRLKPSEVRFFPFAVTNLPFSVPVNKFAKSLVNPSIC